MTSKRKLKFMSFQEKLKAIELIGKGKSQRKIAKELGIGRTTLYNALKNKEKIFEASKKFPEGTNKRRISTTKHPEIERAVLEFIAESRQNGERLTGSAIQSLALAEAAKLGFDDFSGSNGWLFSFFKRNNITIKELNEGVDVKKRPSVVEDSYDSQIIGVNEEEGDCPIEEDTREEEEEFLYSETIESEELAVVVNWRDWCRVCGSTETLPELEQDILEIVVKLLNFAQCESIKVCSSCHSSFQAVSLMIDRSRFVENMFIELEEYERTNYVTQEDIICIRERYEMKNEDDGQSTELFEVLEENYDDEKVAFEEDKSQWHDDEELMVEELENEEISIVTDESCKELERSASKGENRIYRKVMVEQQQEEEEEGENTLPNKRSPEEDAYNYTCHVCFEVFERMCFLTNHTRQQHDCLPKVACTCGRLLATWDSLMAHKRKHSNEPRNWICDLCDASFITKNGLTIHIKFKHQTPQQQPLHLCTTCGKEFKDTYTMKNHERTHLPDEERYIYECNICAKKFTQRGSLKIHINSVHHGQKSIICHLCSKRFSSNYYLKTHILTHAIENVRCDICDSVFKNRVSLQNHKKKIHKPKELLNFVCEVCDRRFHNRNHLERHMPTHTGERNYRCTVENCNYAFKWEKDLKNHMARVHDGEKKNRCLWCDRTFFDSGNLRKHKIRYHAEELAEFEMKFGRRRRLKDLILTNDGNVQQ